MKPVEMFKSISKYIEDIANENLDETYVRFVSIRDDEKNEYCIRVKLSDKERINRGIFEDEKKFNGALKEIIEENKEGLEKLAKS